MGIAEEIKSLASGMLASESHFIVDVIVSSKRGPAKVMVILDGDNGVTIDDCADLSRSLSKTLDDRNLLEEKYTLEVSTPGLDQPLRLKRQYHKNIGRGLKIVCEGRNVEGTLKDVHEELIIIEEKTGTGKKAEVREVSIPFSTIDKAFVKILFK